MNVNIRNLELALKVFSKVLPPIKYSINREGTQISLTNQLHRPRKSRGSKSKRAKLFYAFLFERGDLLAYIHNVFSHNNRYVMRNIGIGITQTTGFIDEAFEWSRSPQGDPYWQACHDEWLEYITQNEL